MKPSVWIVGDQLSLKNSALLPPDECVVVMIESIQRAEQLPYHKQKLTLVWSAMRHFRDELRALGYKVDYFALHPVFSGALGEHIARFRPETVRFMEGSEWGATERMTQMVESRGARAQATPDSLFIAQKDEFRELVGERNSVVFEEFYRAMRRRTGLLMDGGKPIGGSFNYDIQNRERVPKGHVFPNVPTFEPDEITREVMRAVEQFFPDNFGEVEGFWWPVTRTDAEAVRDDFLDNRLDLFGPYEDAFVSGERALYHSMLSALTNIGLLDSMESCRAAERRYHDGKARLNSVEGYIRQLLGWREFIRQFFWWKMPQLLEANHFGADVPLPAFFHDADTDMNCISETVSSLRKYGTSHHIQRLMVLGNFALIAGINPREMRDWFWLAYADAYEWVVTPNVIGISLHADGGQARGGIATKPYAASANYINRMSDYCKPCRFDPKKSVGADACPFNALYWDFLARHEAELRENPRMNAVMLGLGRQTGEQRAALAERAGELRALLRRGERLRAGFEPSAEQVIGIGFGESIRSQKKRQTSLLNAV